MSNLALIRARGMGGLGFDPSTGLPTTPPVYTPPSSSSNPNWWQSILLTLPGTVSGIWQTALVTRSPYGANAAVLQPGFYQQQPVPQYDPRNQNPGGNSNGAGITPNGINLFGTTIGWGTIMLGVGIIVILQMQPLSRGKR
jgi:hypothetical protein